MIVCSMQHVSQFERLVEPVELKPSTNLLDCQLYGVQRTSKNITRLASYSSHVLVRTTNILCIY